MERRITQHFSSNVNSTIISGSYNNNTINLTAGVDERAELLSWISPLEPRNRHQDVCVDRVQGVGGWVLRTAEFQAWYGKESAHKTLFCCGNPGVGKTFVSSLVIDTVCDGTAGSNVGIACLYCDYRGQREQVPVSMIGSLLKQFVAALPEIPEELVGAFQAAKRQIGGRALQLERMLEIFPKVLKSFDRAFICIDAVDEFAADYRAGFFGPLNQIVEKSPNTSLFLTGRPHIQLELDTHLTGSFGVVSIQPSLEDVRLYLTTRLENDSEPDAMDDELGSEIVAHIVEQHAKIFLLVRLHMEAIMGEVTTVERREKLYQTTSGLSDAYSETLGRIKRQRGYKPTLGMAALMWVSLAERPLRVAELCHALAVRVGSTKLDTGKIPSIQTVLSCCLGLITIDQETSTVRLIHETLQEHLRTHLDLFHTPHATIADACLTYLDFDLVRELSPALTAAPSVLPLVDYASSYWGIHSRKELTECTQSLALRILKRCPEHVAANIFILNTENPWELDHYSEGFSGLHYAASFGIQELVASLLNIGSRDLNQKDFKGRTPLVLAAKNGHEGVVKVLLDWSGVNPNAADNHGQSPLSWAANNGHEGVVMVLLSRSDINANAADNFSQTPLGWAAKNGHEGVLKLLLGRTDVDPSAPDMDGRTPLLWAATNGHEGVVKVLLDRAAFTLNLSDYFGQSPLSRAAKNGHEGVVKMLLSRADVDPNATDRQDRTPLYWAAGEGHGAVVKVLLERDGVDHSIRDKDGRTLLCWAASQGHEGVVRVLLSQPDVNPNATDLKWRTPLCWAAFNGHEGVTRILLDRDDTDSTDANIRTLLDQASQNGHEGVVRMLVNRADFNPNSADINGQTPLHLAIENSRAGLVKILLDRPDTNPNSADINGQTPLHLAARGGRAGLAKILLDRPDTNPNWADRFGSTPLMRAAGCIRGDERRCRRWPGLENLVKLLLDQPGTNPNLKNGFGITLFDWAVERGYKRLMELLLDRPDTTSL